MLMLFMLIIYDKTGFSYNLELTMANQCQYIFFLSHSLQVIKLISDFKS